MWTSDGAHDCQGCDKCNTTYAGHPDHHKELQPHEWGTKFDQNTGKPYKICELCYETDEKSFKEAKIKDEDIVIERQKDVLLDDEGNIIGAKVYDEPAKLEYKSEGGPAPEDDIPPIEIPKDLDAAIEYLDTEENRKFVLDSKSEDDFGGSVHHGFGTGIRNGWGLWSGSELQTWFKDRGIHHADDMSGIIFSSYYRHVKGEPIDLDSQIKHYRDFWDKNNPKVNEGNL